MRTVRSDKQRMARRLVAASRIGDENLVKLLIALGADINGGNRSGTTALMAAGRCGQIGAIRLLLSRGARIDAWSNQGMTALMAAAYRGQNNAVAVLLDHGAVIDAVDNRWEPAIYKAAQQGHASTCRLLLARGAPPNQGPRHSHYTPLVAASMKGHLDVVRTFLDHGVDPDYRNSTGPPPLVLCRSVLVADLLLRRGADLNTALYYGRTPLMMAAAVGQADLVRFYLEKRADVFKQDPSGRTALVFARYSHNEDSISMLKRAGAKE